MTEELQRLHQRCWDLETQLEISHKRLEISESLQKLFKRHHLSLQHDVERDAELAEREHVWADTRWEVALHAVQISQKLMAAKEMVWKKTVNEEKKKEDGLSEDLNEKDKEIARLRMELERMDDLEKRNEKCFKDLARVSEEFESVSEALKREEIERKEEINTLREELRDSRKANTELQKEIKTMTKEHEKRSKHDADKIQKLKTALRQVKTLIANDPQPSSHQDRKQPRRESGEPVEDFQENDDAETEDFVSPLVQKKSREDSKQLIFILKDKLTVTTSSR
eukprot:TRINITY_DN44783_c0_g1_i4.p1 TRINITY_DN44783_c0_g1~~TRINITY_DN44783_c0_g1_i4.p1  ORF type:complete len:292 (-),score=112.40 TRINITY_DN44783_c0_g1_i4:1312-2157(-)